MDDIEGMNSLIDSLRKCFDDHGSFGAHGDDANRAAQAFTTALGKFGMEPEQFINLAIGEAEVLVSDPDLLEQSKQSVRDFVSEQLKE